VQDTLRLFFPLNPDSFSIRFTNELCPSDNRVYSSCSTTSQNSPVTTTYAVYVTGLHFLRSLWLVWLGGRVVRMLNLQSTGCGFKSWPCRYSPLLSAILGKLLTHTCAYVTKQYNLVPANGRRCLAAGKVTAQGLGEGDEHPLTLS